MKLSLCFVTALVVAASSALPSAQAAASSGAAVGKQPGGPDFSVPVQRKRTSDDVFDLDAHGNVRAILSSMQVKYAKSLHNYQQNTGIVSALLNLTSTIDLTKLFPHARRDQGFVSLTDQHSEMLWTGPISFGDPEQVVQLDFDTGSTDTFINPGVYKLDASKANTKTNKTFTVEYADGSKASGNVYQDDVRFGGLRAKKQAIGVATQSSLSDDGSQGISGMAFPAISQFKEDPVWMTLSKQGQLSQPLFAFGLSVHGARLDLGGIDEKSFSGEITYTPVDDATGFWMTDGKVNGMNVKAIIDTGTTIILGPPEQVMGACLAAGGMPQSQPSGNSVQVLCGFNKDLYVPSFKFQFGVGTFELSRDAMFFDHSNGLDIAPIVGADVGLADTWIIGDSFLRDVYAVFDFGEKRVGFAPRKL